MTEALLLVLTAALVALCAVFVAGEFAFLAVDRATISRAARSGDPRAAGAQRVFATLSTQLSGIQLGITLTSLAIGFVAEPALATLLEGPLGALGLRRSAVEGTAVGLALGIATLGTMVFGELVPKNLAIARPVETTLAVQGFVRGFTRVAAWPIRGLNGTANAVLRLVGLQAAEELASARSAEELLSLVRRSATLGTLESDTASLLQRSLVFGDKRASDVMVSRRRMRTLSAGAPVTELIEAVRRTGHSRFPVTGADLDDVVGVVHVKAAVAVPDAERAGTPVSAVMAPPVLVPGTVDLDSLLNTLQSGGLQMAVVLDEFGGTDGLVTIEDLIEELVGEVVDEHDRTSVPVRRRRGGWSVSGLLRPDEVTAATGVAVPEGPDYGTLGGLVVQLLGRIPTAGDAASTAGVRLVVERMDGLRVDRVLLAAAGEEPQ